MFPVQLKLTYCRRTKRIQAHVILGTCAQFARFVRTTVVHLIVTAMLVFVLHVLRMRLQPRTMLHWHDQWLSLSQRTVVSLQPLPGSALTNSQLFSTCLLAAIGHSSAVHRRLGWLLLMPWLATIGGLWMARVKDTLSIVQSTDGVVGRWSESGTSLLVLLASFLSVVHLLVLLESVRLVGRGWALMCGSTTPPTEDSTPKLDAADVADVAGLSGKTITFVL